MRNPSQITAALAVDEPLVQDANYELDSDDRQYLDNQIRGVQEHLVTGLIRGVVATWVRLSPSSAAGAIGDVVCLVGTGSPTEPTVTRALAAAMANAGGVYGVLLRAASPGAMALVAIGGSLLPPTVTGLAASSGGERFAYVNTATARLARASSAAWPEYVVGTVDASGWTSVAIRDGGLGSTTISMDDTPTRLRRIPIAAGTYRALRYVVKVQDATAAIYGEWEVKCGYTSTGGVLTARHSTVSTVVESNVALDVTVTPNGITDIDINGFGLALTTLTWTVSEFAL